ncbi:MAG TPA: phage tail tape measure protein [Actinomycetota bacterium]|nr:phage tail tape measure protein [Actinomycetota bacterium]
MATSIETIVVKVIGDTRGLSTALNAASLAVVAFAGASVKAAVDYDQAFTRIAAVSNASREDIEKWREDVKGLAGRTARAPQELAEALYFLASAGLKTNQIMPTLAASAKAAASGLGETQDIARLTANVLNAYADSGIRAADVTDTLVAAVREGTAEPNEFADAMGRILPIASKAGVSFDEVAASLSSLSNIGLDVNEGVTAMRGVLNALEAPGTQAAETMKKIGISADEMRDIISEEGLLGALRLLEDRTNGNIDVIRDIIPNVRALTGMFGLTGQEAEKVSEIFDHVRHSTGDLDNAFKTTSRGSAFRFQQLMARLRVVMIDVGEALLPVVEDVVEVIGDLAKAFSNLSPAIQGTIVKVGLLLAAFKLLGGPALIGGIVRLGGSLIGLGGSAATAATGLGAVGAAPIVAGIALVTGGIVALKLAMDNANEEVDQITEDLRQGTTTAAELAAENQHLAETNNEVASASKNQGIAMKFASVQMNVNTTQVDQNTEALARYKAGIENMLLSHNVAGQSVESWTEIMMNARGITEEQRHALARQVGTLHLYGASLDSATKRGVANLLVQGDFVAAYKLLRTGVREATKEVRGYARTTAANAESARLADHAQRLFAGGARAAGHDAENASDKVKTYKSKLDEIPRNVNTNITVDTSGALSRLGELNNTLSEVAYDRFIDVHLTTSGGSTGFELLDHLEKRLREITDEDWSTNVRVGATVGGGAAGRGIDGLGSRSRSGGLTVRLDRRRFDEELDYDSDYRGWG